MFDLAALDIVLQSRMSAQLTSVQGQLTALLGQISAVQAQLAATQGQVVATQGQLGILSAAGTVQQEAGTLANGQLTLSGFSFGASPEILVQRTSLVAPGELAWTGNPMAGTVQVVPGSGTDNSPLLVTVRSGGTVQQQQGTLLAGQLTLSGFVLNGAVEVTVQRLSLVAPGPLAVVANPSTGQITVLSASGTDGSNVLVTVRPLGTGQQQTGSLQNGQLVLSGFTLLASSKITVQRTSLVTPGPLAWVGNPTAGTVSILSGSGKEKSAVVVTVR
jgi:hypothetical protein